MPSQTEIIEAMTMGFVHAVAPINGDNDSAFTMTYQFDNALPTDDFSGLSGWRAWDSDERAAVEAALAHIETFLNVDFVKVSGNADPDLNLGMVSLPGATAGYGGIQLWTWSDGSFADYDAFATWDKTLDITSDFNLILHELGHALGLDHPFEGVLLDEAYDTNHYSVMSYDIDPQSGEKNDAMMLYDILALQNIWGAADHNTGTTTYTGPRTDNVDVVWDTGGTDTFDASARGNDVTLDLRAGRFSTFGSYEDLAIAFGVTIENATGGNGDDRLTGNGAANTLVGNGGSDLLKGVAGNDTLSGGNGKDVLKGGSARDRLAGDGGNDRLYGGKGKDVLEGGAGTDKLWGGAGRDTFRFIEDADREVVRDFEAGTDTLEIVGMGNLSAVLDLAEERNGDVRFAFGDGDLLIVKNITLDLLETDIAIA